MAETIRDVVIKIRLQQVENRLAPPDLSAFRQRVQEAERLAQSATQRAASDPGLDKARQTFLNALDDDSPAASTRRAGKSGASGGGGSSVDAGAVAKQRLEAIGALTESTARLAKGVIFLTAANEEEAQSMLRSLAAAQGFFDLIGGGTATVKNFITLQQAFAVANNAAAASGTRAAAATASQLAAGNGLAQVATRILPVLGAWAAVGATFTYAAWAAYTEEAKDAAKATQDVIDARQRAHDVDRKNEAEAREFGKSALDRIRQSQNARLESLRGDVLGGAAQVMADLRTQETQAINTRRQGSSSGYIFTQEQRLSNVKAEAQYQEEMERIIRDQLSVQRQVTSELERQQSVAMNQLETAKQKVETEKRALEDQTTAFGRLTPGEQSRAKSIADNLNKGGKLNEADARFAEQVGLGGSVTNAFFRQRGQDAGASSVQKAFGFTQPLEQAEKDLRDANAQFGAALQGLEEEITNSKQAEAKQVDRLVQVIRDKFVAQSLIEELIKRIEGVERNQKNGGLANKS